MTIWRERSIDFWKIILFCNLFLPVVQLTDYDESDEKVDDDKVDEEEAAE